MVSCASVLPVAGPNSALTAASPSERRPDFQRLLRAIPFNSSLKAGFSAQSGHGQHLPRTHHIKTPDDVKRPRVRTRPKSVRVKSGKARNEHNMSGLPPKAELQSERLMSTRPSQQRRHQALPVAAIFSTTSDAREAIERTFIHPYNRPVIRDLTC
jgi:hypothetical protein